MRNTFCPPNRGLFVSLSDVTAPLVRIMMGNSKYQLPDASAPV